VVTHCTILRTALVLCTKKLYEDFHIAFFVRVIAEIHVNGLEILRLFKITDCGCSVVTKYLFVLQEATVNTLITIEVICWFFVGEIIGKGGLIGYHIPGAVDYEVYV